MSDYSQEVVFNLAIEDLTYFLKQARDATSSDRRQKALKQADATLSSLVQYDEVATLREQSSK